MKYRTSVIVLGFLLTGCAIGPDYTPPSNDELLAEPIFSSKAEDLIDEGPVDGIWWEQFNDPVLASLLDKAAQQNTDLRVAVARIEAAQSVFDATRGQGLPRISSSTSAERLQASEQAGAFGSPPGQSSLQNLFSTSVAASWEVDLFGRISQRVRAAAADTEAAWEETRLVLLIVQSETALAYAELRSLQNQFRVAKEAERLARNTLNLAQLLESSDLSSELDIARARAEVTELVARQEELIGGQRAAASRIAYLVGEPPENLMSSLLEAKPFTLNGPKIPIGMRSDLLLRRPDVRAAERRLAAATARVGAEQADLYPSFSLTGGGGFSSVSLDDLIEGASGTWSVSGFIRWPIFDGGIQRAEIRIADSRREIALAEFDGAVLSALSEVEASLSSYVHAARQARGLRSARSDRLKAYELAERRFQVGLDDLFPTLDAQRSLTALDSEIALADAQVLVSVISVYRALAGGWDQAAPANSPGVASLSPSFASNPS